jgi:hypothetical protein
VTQRQEPEIPPTGNNESLKYINGTKKNDRERERGREGGNDAYGKTLKRNKKN